MSKSVTVVVNHESDERVIQQIAAALRANNGYSTQLRDFADTISKDQPVNGLQFQPRPGHILVCHFGLGFQKPEIVKTRPVLVISPHQREWTRVCIVVPISSKAPTEVKPYHYKLPDGLIPNAKYKESWIKGDLAVAVANHRLDRLKTGFRKYESPMVPADVLKAARQCVLHAAGMHALTEHW